MQLEREREGGMEIEIVWAYGQTGVHSTHCFHSFGASATRVALAALDAARCCTARHDMVSTCGRKEYGQPLRV